MTLCFLYIFSLFDILKLRKYEEVTAMLYIIDSANNEEIKDALDVYKRQTQRFQKVRWLR